MLEKILRWSLLNRALILFSTLAIFFFGIFTLKKLPIDVFPDLNRPTVTIMTEAGGLDPEEVEKQVTFPLEVLLKGLPGVQRLRSQSGVGLSVIWVEFNWNTDIYLSRQLVNEKLTIAKNQIPEGIKPVMAPISSLMGEIMLISVRGKSEKTSPLEIRSIADWSIRPRLMAIPGIAQVTNIGGEVKQYQILISPNKLRQFGITLEEVITAAKKANITTNGGFLADQNQDLLFKITGRINSLEELKKSIVSNRNGIPISIADLAEVKIGARIKRGDGGTNAKKAVIMSIAKQPGASTLELTKKVEAVIQEIQKGMNQELEINSELFRQANFIETAIANVIEALRDGTMIVIIIIFLFLLNFRITTIVITALPLSFMITFFVFRWFDISINTMTLGGLAVAIGELVDDSIVDIENIYRRLKENKNLAKPETPLKVIFNASLEIRGSIVYATLIVVLVFLPLFFLSGMEGKLLMPLGLAYITSLLASLIVSLTVTPVLASYLLPKAKFINKKQESFLVRLLKKYDEKLLRLVLANPNKIIYLSGILFLLSLFVLFSTGREFLPPFNEGTLTINIQTNPGISLNESNKIGQIAEQLILQTPEVISTGRRTGRAEMDEHAEGVHYSEIDINLKKGKRNREEIVGEIRKKLALIPGISLNIGQPISHRIDHLMSGVRAQIAVKIYGDDLGLIREKAEFVRKMVTEIEGTTDVQIEKQVLIPQLIFRIKRDEAARYGLKTGDLAEAIQTALGGIIVSEVIEDQRRFELLVRFSEDYRKQKESLKNIKINSEKGWQIPLEAVAEISEIKGPNQILRENGQRRIVVMANTTGKPLVSVAELLKNKLEKELLLPTGYFWELSGQFEAQKEATRDLLLLTLFSVCGVFFLLIKALGDWRLALQVMVNVPLALIGGVFALAISGGVFSVSALVGFISLIGIASRNGIMMLSHYLHLIKESPEDFGKELIIRGSLERLVPVTMTALTAGLSLIPLALAVDQPGKEILQPLAVVILGGIITATLLDQAVTPAIFYRFGQKSVEKAMNKSE